MLCEHENTEIQTGIDFKNAMYSIQTGPDATSLPGMAQLSFLVLKSTAKVA